ncbi:hypothetical protein E6O75_ATG04093 [Venturia nashicola]|uniref:Uncharacterized protein n=1 Tax=Venturia nashicola TaxID=86259 RepID=A0A4Z1P9P2_9PEZI|nr:hypothetical protein E6O75_ATG04093 [Venturia nashicola]
MAKLRSTSRTHSPPPRRRETISKARPMEETTIGKAYASPFLALLARIGGEATRINATPLHGFFMPSYQLEKKDTIFSPLKAIGNYLSPNSTTKSAKKQFTATRGRIAPTPVSVTSDKSRENLADVKYCSPFETIGNRLSTTESVNKTFNGTRGRISPMPVDNDKFKENLAAARKPAQSSVSESLHKIKEANLEFEKQTSATIKFATNAVTHGLPSSTRGGQIGDIPGTFRPVEMRDTIEKEIGEVDFGEVLRALWMEDAVFHRRLTTAAFVVVLLMMFGKWLFVVSML